MSKIHTTAFNTLGAVDQWMKVISGNVTGATITGYKGTSVEFGEVLADQMRPGVRATRWGSGALATSANGTVPPARRGTTPWPGIGTDTALGFSHA